MDEKNSNKLVGWMVLGLIFVGIFGLVGGIFSFINEYDYVGTGLCLIASALAFGNMLKAYQ